MTNFSTYRHRITIQEETQVADGAGGYTTAWANRLTTWGKITPKRGKQALEAGQIVQGKPYTVRMRYREDLLSFNMSTATLIESLRLKYDGRIFDIHSVIVIGERDMEYEIEAMEKVQ